MSLFSTGRIPTLRVVVLVAVGAVNGFTAVSLIPPVNAAATIAAATVVSQTPKIKNPVQKAGKYAVELRVPADGLYAGQEVDMEFRVTDTSREDPVNGAPGVVRAKIVATTTMPAMASMPPAKPKIHSEGVPGDYGLVTTFPHGGEFVLTLTITPPGDGAEPFTVSFPVSVKDEDTSRKRKPAEKPYTLEIRSVPQRPVAGQEARLTIGVKELATGKMVTAFDEVHTQPIHLFFVRDDLGAFFHEHPTPGADGTFTHTFTFPTGGEWHVFADTAPQGAGAQVIMAKLNVEGIRAPHSMLVAQNTPLLVREGGYTLALKNPKLPANESVLLTFELRDNQGQPVNDMDLWLGALAHLVMIERDGQSFVHSHPDETDPRNGRGGTLTFNARFPKPGTYKGWLQFQRQGSIHTIPFVVRASGKS